MYPSSPISNLYKTLTAGLSKRTILRRSTGVAMTATSKGVREIVSAHASVPRNIPLRAVPALGAVLCIAPG